MAHRELPEHGPWWRAGRDLLFCAAAMAVFSALFVVGDLLVYGHVNW